MRAERFAPIQPQRASIGSGTLILAAIGCFAIGFVALMAVPRIWPRYVQTVAAGPSQPLQTLDVSKAAPAPVVQASTPVPGVIQELRPTAAPEPQKIATYGALTALNECKAAIRAGDSYERVGPDQMAAMFGTRGRPLTPTQLDAGCRKLTE